MPIITVYNAFGLELVFRSPDEPETWGHRRVWRKKLAGALQTAACSVKALKITDHSHVAVHVLDCVSEPVNLIYVSVDILFSSKERTRKVRTDLARALRDAVDAVHLAYGNRDKHPYKIEVAVRRFDARTDVFLLPE